MIINDPNTFKWLDEQYRLMRDLKANPDRRLVFTIGYTVDDFLAALDFRVKLADFLEVESFEFTPEIEAMLTDLSKEILGKADVKRAQSLLCTLLHTGIRMGQRYAIQRLYEQEGKTVRPELRYL
jgi:hypothetical protein